MSKKEREICELDLFDEFVCLRSNPVRNDNINSAERPGLKTGAENWIFWSEIGSGFGESAGTPPTKNCQEYPPGNTLFLFSIIRMPYFLASDELTLATFIFEPETFLP